MDIQLTDVTIHIDENLDVSERKAVEDKLRALKGVVSVHNPDKTPHLTMIEYDPKEVDSTQLLEAVKAQGVHAEMIGL